VTQGQQKALLQLRRIESSSDGAVDVICPVETKKGNLNILFGIRLGVMARRPGGLRLREREEFVLIVHPEFPFQVPGLVVDHDRFADFPHVVWSNTICLYQSDIEWNPADGLFGYLDRLNQWLGKAALNDMDPIEGPLEPPHHLMSLSKTPFIIRANSPIAAGDRWLGLAEVRRYANRIEVVGWHSDPSLIPLNTKCALTVVLPKRLPMEFPRKGAQFFAELLKQGVDKKQIVTNLALAALFTEKDDPIHLVLGTPMRRGTDGAEKVHFAVWTTAPEVAKYVKDVLPETSDSDKIALLREEIADIIYNALSNADIAWSRVLEDRSEIVVRRDFQTPATWLSKKRILVLGCGALGSWVAESAARADARAIFVVDDSIVRPGLLVRQNYRSDDIGEGKAEALANRLHEINPYVELQLYQGDAFKFVLENRFKDFDVVIECTASRLFQMKLERAWHSFARRTPLMMSFIINGSAQHCLGVIVARNSPTGLWNGYMQLKRQICTSAQHPEIVEAFYGDRTARDLFQPEPGCSDPTFSGSSLDVMSLSAFSFNLALQHADSIELPLGLLFSTGHKEASATSNVMPLSRLRDIKVRDYRVRMDSSIFREAHAWVKQNARIRSPKYETGGLLWGQWDDAVGIIWISALSGPPRDSIHDPSGFICGVEGTSAEHVARLERSRGSCGFIGFWHTHPKMIAEQSIVDVAGMSTLVAGMGLNHRRAIMLIFGRAGRRPTAGIYIYESSGATDEGEIVAWKPRQIITPFAVV
jgi:hypothetical protein